MTFALGFVVGAAIMRNGPLFWRRVRSWRRRVENRRIGRRDDFNEYDWTGN